MGATYALHECNLPGCTKMTHNRVYCSKECMVLGQLRDRPTGTRVCKRCKIEKPALEFVHRTKKGHLKSRVWCADCCATLPQEANEKRAATSARRHLERKQEQEAHEEELKKRDWSPVMVEASKYRGELLLNDLVLGGLPGTSTSACPFAA